MIESVEESLGFHRSRFLRNARLPSPEGTTPKDLDLDPVTRERFRDWLADVKSGTVFGGTGRGVLIKGPLPIRNIAAGALVTAAVAIAPEYFEKLAPSAIPIRCLSTTAYLEAVKDAYDAPDGDSDDVVKACKASFTGRAADTHNVRLLVLTNLGDEPRRTVSDFPREELRVLLSLRMERRLPTIVTSRLGSGDLLESYKEEFLEVTDEVLRGVEIRGTQ